MYTLFPILLILVLPVVAGVIIFRWQQHRLAESYTGQVIDKFTKSFESRGDSKTEYYLKLSSITGEREALVTKDKYDDAKIGDTFTKQAGQKEPNKEE